jgi:hypothetical protein
MSNPSPVKKFKPGQSGNPKGSSARAKAQKEISALKVDDIIKLGSELLAAEYTVLSEAAADAKGPVLRMWFAGVIKKGLEDQDAQTMMHILSRLVGKPTETRTLQGPGGNPIEVKALEQTDEEKIERAEKLRQMRIALGGDR